MEQSTEREWHQNGNGDDGLDDVVVDALIAGGSALFAIFLAVPGLPVQTTLWAASVAFGAAFFASLTAARRRTRS